jgi:hypothetical protein
MLFVRECMLWLPSERGCLLCQLAVRRSVLVCDVMPAYREPLSNPCLSLLLCDVFAIYTARWSAVQSPHHALGVVRWQVLSYVCHTQVRPFGFTHM